MNFIQVVVTFADDTSLNRLLPHHLHDVGYELACYERGKFGSAVVHNESLRKDVVEAVGLLVHRECRDVCKRPTKVIARSLLRDCAPKQLAAFNFAELMQELLSLAPTLMKILIYAATSQRKLQKQGGAIEQEEASHLPELFAASLLLKERDKDMSALHHLVALSLYKGGATKQSMKILSALGISNSRSALLRKLEEISQYYNEKVLQWKTAAERHMSGMI